VRDEQKLYELAKPLIDHLRKNCHSNFFVVITRKGATVMGACENCEKLNRYMDEIINR
jgi:hypothetical protein